MSAGTLARVRAGKHVDQAGDSYKEHAQYAEEWARRHPYGQARIEAHRIKAGKAAHRAHRRFLGIRGTR